MVHTLREIKQGDEILTSYIEIYQGRDARRAEFRMKFKFYCECNLREIADATENDTRKKEIAALNNLVSALAQRDPTSAFGYAKRLLRCIENEDEGAITWLS